MRTRFGSGRCLLPNDCGETRSALLRLAGLVASATSTPRITMKLTQRTLVAVLIAAIALPVTGFAAKGERRKKNADAAAIPAFAAVDKNGDDSVTEAEFVAANDKLGADAAKTRFGLLDKNSDGKLSKEEYAAGATPEKKKRKKNQQ